MWLSCDCVFFLRYSFYAVGRPTSCKTAVQTSCEFVISIFNILTSLFLSFCLCLSLLSLLFSSSLSYLQKMTYDRNYKMKYDNFQKSLAQKRPVSIHSSFSHLSSFNINLCVSLLLPFFIFSFFLLSLSLSLFLSLFVFLSLFLHRKVFLDRLRFRFVGTIYLKTLIAR